MRALRPAPDDARALAEGRASGDRALDARAGRRRRLLPEAGPAGSARLRGDGADPVPVRPRRPTRSARPRSRSSAGRRRWGRSRFTRGPSAATTSTIPTSCGSTSTRSRAPTSPTPSASPPRRGALLDELGYIGLPEDLGRPRHPHLRPDRAALDVHRRPPRRDRVRARARAAAARSGDDQVVEGGARRAHLHRLQPERARPHDRLGLQRATQAGRAGVGAADLGRAAEGWRPRTSRWRRCRPGSPSAATATRRSTTSRTRLRRCSTCTSATRDEGDMPYPPDYPKMPGEPKRVQPSRDRDRHQRD